MAPAVRYALAETEKMAEHTVVEKSRRTYLSSIHSLLRFCFDGPSREREGAAACFVHSREFIQPHVLEVLEGVASNERRLKQEIARVCENIHLGGEQNCPFVMSWLTHSLLLYWSAGMLKVTVRLSRTRAGRLWKATPRRS